MTNAAEQYFAPNKRRPQFKVTPGRRSDTSRAGMFRLTPRDIEILASIAEHRFLTSDQICRLVGEGRTRDRLTECFHQDLVHRPPQQRDLHMRGGVLLPGSIAKVYALSEKGAKLLVDLGRIPSAQAARKWQRDNLDASRLFIGHTLSCAELKIALTLATKDHPNVRLQAAGELAQSIPRDFHQHPGRPFSLRARLVHDGVSLDLGVDCDVPFALDDTAQKRKAHFLTEIDEDNMPIVRYKRDGSVSLKGTSMMRKFLAYDAAHAAGLHTKLFGWTTFRVPVLTTTQAHADNMAKAVAAMHNGKGSNLFWFACRDIAKSANILQETFSDCWGKEHRLVG
jgi:hypothetical protein